jgi:hypothetical protein
MVTNDTWRRILAREWLLFLGLFLFGLVATPIVIAAWQPAVLGLHSSDAGGWGRYCLEFLAALCNRNPLMWLAVWAPYLIVQAGRSAGWAIDVLNGGSR